MKGQREVGKAIICVRNEIARTMEYYRGDEGISRAQGSVLHYVFRNENKDVYQKDIEQEFNLRRASASELLAKLESSGYIERVNSITDKRLKKIQLTQKGIGQIEKVRKDIEKMEKVLHENVSEEELEVFFHVIDKMFYNCKTIQDKKKGELL